MLPALGAAQPYSPGPARGDSRGVTLNSGRDSGCPDKTDGGIKRLELPAFAFAERRHKVEGEEDELFHIVVGVPLSPTPELEVYGRL